ALRGRGPAGAAGRPLLAALLGLAILQALFFSRIPLSVAVPYYRGVVERFYPLPDIAVALLVGLGAAAMLARLEARAARTAAGIALAALLGGAPLAAHFATLDQRGNTTIEDLGRNLLAALPRDAVLFANGDIVYNSLIELQVVEGVRPDVTLVEQYLLTRAWYVHAMRRRHPELLPAFTTHAEPDSDRYRGDSLSGNLRWIDHLNGVRPVAFTGFIDPTFGTRYEMVRTGLVLVPLPRGAAPPPGERARAAVRLLETLALDSFFRRQDPLGPEAESRWRTTQFVASVCFLLCETDGQTITSAEFPGLRVLAGFLDRYESWTPSPDAELLRAAGFLHVYHPEFRSPARAARALEGYLASGATGAEADGAARLLDAIRSAR
ncbi:MAG TPA: hypothetical protein VJY35_04600, partial [Candidatus Eisenbacteria bacterium]|nr:hypothetical protein [Candidatus Eisenbacteria bacterium]